MSAGKRRPTVSKSKDPQPRVPKLTQAGLKELGWTKTMIETLLPEPELKDNPHYKCAAPMKLWAVEIVEAVMETPEYAAAAALAAKRKAAAKKADETKTANAIALAGDLSDKITIKVIPAPDLRSRTLAAKQAWYDSLDIYDYPSDAYSADQLTVDRWMVNYIRHNLTEYDRTLYDHIHIRTCKGWLIYTTIKEATLHKIADAYPYLADECMRQAQGASYDAISRR